MKILNEDSQPINESVNPNGAFYSLEQVKEFCKEAVPDDFDFEEAYNMVTSLPTLDSLNIFNPEYESTLKNIITEKYGIFDAKLSQDTESWVFAIVELSQDELKYIKNEVHGNTNSELRFEMPYIVDGRLHRVSIEFVKDFMRYIEDQAVGDPPPYEPNRTDYETEDEYVEAVEEYENELSANGWFQLNEIDEFLDDMADNGF